MGEKEWSPESVFDLFGDDLVRRILVLASDRAVSADDLDEHLEASRPTIYRRLNALLDRDLLVEHQEIDERGNHYKSFETALERVSFAIEDGGYDIDLELRRGLVDQFQAFWSDLEAAGADGDPAVGQSSTGASTPEELRRASKRGDLDRG